MEKKLKSGYRPRHLPMGTAYCVYCHGAGCEKCGGKGYYIPDLQEPIDPPKQYT